MVAAGIDGVVVCIVLSAGYLGFAGLKFLFDPRGFSFPDAGLVFSIVAGFAVLVVYLTVAWWLSGRSYGCLVMGLRVVNHRGEPLHLAGAFVRALFCAALPIGLLWVAVSRENRSVQDTVLRTSVIYDWQPRGQRPRERERDVTPGVSDLRRWRGWRDRPPVPRGDRSASPRARRP